jgi:hypothetical protein
MLFKFLKIECFVFSDLFEFALLFLQVVQNDLLLIFLLNLLVFELVSANCLHLFSRLTLDLQKLFMFLFVF